MSTRSEKERQKHLQEKYQATLANLLKDDDNKYCVDCDAKGPRWASWNLGIFLCIRCAGIHRNLGVHISKVKSVNLDTWTAEQVAMMMEVGNSRARAAYEAQVPDSFRRPQTDSALESFIRAKYEHKKYVAREWVVPKPTIPKELKGNTLEMDEKSERKKRPKQQSTIQIEAPKSSVPRTQPVEKKTQNTNPPPPVQTKQTSNTEDLLSLNTSPAKQPTTQSSDLLGDLVDIMGPTVSTSQNGNIQSSQPLDSGTQVCTQSSDLLGDLVDIMGPTVSTSQNGNIQSSQPLDSGTQVCTQSSDLLGDLVDIMGPTVSTSQNGNIQSSQPLDSGTQVCTQSSDLLGDLVDIMGPTVSTSQNGNIQSSQPLDSGTQVCTQSSDLLGDLVDIMGPTVSTSQNGNIQSSQPLDSGTQMPNGDLEASLFDDGAAKVQEKSTKDSILALYGPSSQPPQQPMYGVPGGTPYYNVPQSDLGYYNQYDTGGMYMPQQNMGMYGVPQQHGLNNQGGMQQQPMMNNQGGMQQQPMMNNQSGMPQGGMPQGGMPQQPIMNNQYNPQQGQMQQNPNMYGMMGQQNMQPSMAMYNQQPQMATVQSIQYNQMQQQMNNMRLNSGNMVGQPVGATSNGGMGNWGGQGNSGHTLSTNLWQ
ncbi:uncharacterized protein LOC143063734 isoform X1 [Mytilus galloprovincialis]|uniref:uncharacterized protein LOC143063734 isoform X1 n=1 Tax=Mytilus galloprovincialis TaxID=29158 RepID=UPI003F7B87D8